VTSIPEEAISKKRKKHNDSKIRNERKRLFVECGKDSSEKKFSMKTMSSSNSSTITKSLDSERSVLSSSLSVVSPVAKSNIISPKKFLSRTNSENNNVPVITATTQPSSKWSKYLNDSDQEQESRRNSDNDDCSVLLEASSVSYVEFNEEIL